MCLFSFEKLFCDLFNKLQAAALFLALDGTSKHINPSTSGRKYCRLVNNAVFIRNESLFIVSAAARRGRYAPYALRAIEYKLSIMGQY